MQASRCPTPSSGMLIELPAIVTIEKKLDALTVGIVTLPFTFEGSRRKRVAQEGLDALGAEVDASVSSFWTQVGDNIFRAVLERCDRQTRQRAVYIETG